MISVSLTDARARLPELLTRASEGEDVHILRHGRAVAVLIGHDRWMKTARHEVLDQARDIRRRIEEARGKPYPPPPAGQDWDASAHAAAIRADRDDDPWDRAAR
jgi:prevent-host-death family protein